MQEREKALNNFLRVSDQGIFSFGKELKVDWGYSKECEDLLGTEALEGKSIADLFYNDENKQKEFQDIFALIYKNNIDPQEIFDLLDKEVTIGEKEISLQYTCLDAKRIMCVMTNVTEKKKLYNKLKTEQELHEHILKIVSNNKFFGSFLREAENLFQTLDDVTSPASQERTTQAKSNEKGKTISTISREDIQSLILEVHDFKANAGLFWL